MPVHVAEMKKQMTTPSVSKVVEELGLSYTSGETIKCYNHFRKQC